MKNQLHTFSIRSKLILKQPDDDEDADDYEENDEFVDEDGGWEGCECPVDCPSQLTLIFLIL